jgi:starch synthase (maltosyl-transferring)
MEHRPRDRGFEEYLHSEKYQIRRWDLERADSLRDVVAAVNRIRRENPALHGNLSLRFHGIDNPNLLVYSKRSEDRSNVVLVIANLDHENVQSGWTDLALWELGVESGSSFEAEDLLTGDVYRWRGTHNFVKLDPSSVPAHVLLVRAVEGAVTG